MAIVYDFKIWMAVKLGEILKRNIAPSEISLGVVTASGGAKASLVPVTYKGNVYNIAYDKYPIESLINKNLLVKRSIKFAATTTAADIVTALAKFGIVLVASDINMSTVVNDKGIYTVQLSDTCYGYKGAIVAYSSDTVLPLTPLHYWPLKTDTKNYGSSGGADWAPAVTFVSDGAGSTMAKRTTAALAAIGTTLPVNDDFSICIEVLPDDVAGTQGAFTAANTLTVGASMVFLSGRLDVYLSTSYTNLYVNSDTSMLAKAGSKYMLTITRSGKKYSEYVNGVLTKSVDVTTAAQSSMTHFGAYNGGNYWGTGMRFANISYYDVALTAEQVLNHANNVYGNRQ